MFKTRYRIAQVYDEVLEHDYFYIQRKDYPWCSWYNVVTPSIRYSTLKNAQTALKHHKNIIYHY